MFGNSSYSAVEIGLAYLERIIDLIVRLFNALGKGNSGSNNNDNAPKGDDTPVVE